MKDIIAQFLAVAGYFRICSGWKEGKYKQIWLDKMVEQFHFIRENIMPKYSPSEVAFIQWLLPNGLDWWMDNIPASWSLNWPLNEAENVLISKIAAKIITNKDFDLFVEKLQIEFKKIQRSRKKAISFKQYKPEAQSLVVAEPEAQSLIVVKPEAQSLVVVKLEAQSLVVAEPEAQSLVVVKPEAQSLVVVKLEAQSLVVAEPEAQSLVVAKPVDVADPEAQSLVVKSTKKPDSLTILKTQMLNRTKTKYVRDFYMDLLQQSSQRLQTTIGNDEEKQRRQLIATTDGLDRRKPFSTTKQLEDRKDFQQDQLIESTDGLDRRKTFSTTKQLDFQQEQLIATTDGLDRRKFQLFPIQEFGCGISAFQRIDINAQCVLVA